MSHPDEKGTNVTPTERSSKTSSAATGLFARLRASVRGHGSGAPSFIRGFGSLPSIRRIALATSLCFSVGVMVLAASSAPAFANVPFGLSLIEFNVQEVNATRSALHFSLEPPTGSDWKVEYSAVSADGPWTLGGTGSAEDREEHTIELNHLIPQTRYYTRAIATKDPETAEAVSEFTTTAISVPLFLLPHSPIRIASHENECEGYYGAGFAASGFCPVGRPTPTSYGLATEVYANGANTSYRFEYSTSKSDVESGSGTVVAGASGSVSAAEEVKVVPVDLEGLRPETTYYVSAVGDNEKGVTRTAPMSFTTHTADAQAGEVVANPAGNSAYLRAGVSPNGFETHWRFEYATSSEGPWSDGPEGTIPQAQSAFGGEELYVEAELTGLNPVTSYYVRLLVENEPEPGHPAASTSEKARAFHTSGPPAPETFAVHALHGEALRLLGYLEPNSSGLNELQTVTIGGAPTGGTFTLTTASVALTASLPKIPFDASHQEVQNSLEALPGAKESVEVLGPAGGPYTVEFIDALGSTKLPLEADASGLTPSSTVAVASVHDGFGYATHYHFEYVAQKSFEEHGWAKAQSTPEVEFSGVNGGYVGEDLPPLQAGGSYRYRLTATNATPGDPVVHGNEQALTAPTTVEAGSAATCPNERFRTGPSANLSDCRAYEQVTPHDKEGSIQPFRFEAAIENQGAAVGEDGEHVVLSEAYTHWGSGTSDGGSPYFFTRGSDGVWRMTAGTPQPAAGLAQYRPELLSPDLTSFAFPSDWDTGVSETPDFEFMAGAPGGPYTTVASVPRGQVGQKGGWVGASEDFSKLILAVEDRTLTGHNTGTAQGLDLYEYAGGVLRQANVLTGGAKVGTCGARLPVGLESYRDKATSSRYAVSADGSRVFFEAVPGSVCSDSEHLYERVNGEKTLDLGAYTFLAANKQGTEVLLESAGGIFLEQGEAAAPRLLFMAPVEGSTLQISQDLSTIYLSTGQHLTAEAPPAGGGSYLYRYDVGGGGSLRFLGSFLGSDQYASSGVSPDGRYFYWTGSAEGVPGGGVQPGTDGLRSEQLMRYDSVEDVVSCVSCASPFDSEPKNSAGVAAQPSASLYGSNKDNTPYETFFSGDGNYAFFTTTAALVPKDVNGELPSSAHAASPSEDVYEWRRGGVDGCAAVQGCVSLISSGGEGYLVYLIGAADEGRDVFFTTRAKLGPNDNDNALDIYDARIGGGEPPLPPRPVECEGDACSTPASAPNDATPSSLTFSGLGNLMPLPPVKSVVRPKQHRQRKSLKQHRQRKVRHRTRRGTRVRSTTRGHRSARRSSRAVNR